jgi:hypothetical protein
MRWPKKTGCAACRGAIHANSDPYFTSILYNGKTGSNSPLFQRSQFLIQVRQRVSQQFLMTRVLAGLQLLKHPPPGQFKILAITLAGSCFRTQFDVGR